MENINLKSIRWESIKSVFLSIAHAEKISRADISAETDLSLMTVGKVADALLDIHVIEQCKETKTSAGRRAGLLSINPENFAVVLDLTSRNFSCCIMNMRLKCMEKLPFHYVDSMSFSDNLEQFLRHVSQFLSNSMDTAFCIGMGVSVPGPYFPDTDHTICPQLPPLEQIAIAATVRKHISIDPLYIETGYNAAATSNISYIADYKEKTILYWCISETAVHGAVIHRGDLLRGAHHLAGNFGRMLTAPAKPLNAVLSLSNSPEENALELARAIHNVMRILDPDTIILECTMYENGADFSDLVRQMLIEKFDFTPTTLPQITVTSESTPHAYRGLTIQLRESWLHERIFGAKE